MLRSSRLAIRAPSRSRCLTVLAYQGTKAWLPGARRWLPRFRGPVLVALALVAGALDSGAGERLTLNLNPDWRFIKADPPGAAAPVFDDASWARVSLPHTYNDVDTFDNWSTPGHRGEQIQWAGRTWYRKTFTLPAALRGQRVYIEFEGVRQVAEVYLNGHLLGVSKSGFTPFGFDLTPHLRFGAASNLLAVMCDNRFMKDPLDAEALAALGTATQGGRSLPNPNLAKLSEDVNQGIPDALEDLAADQIPWNNPHWHPAHGGIYRNVRLHVTDPLHISLPLMSFLGTVGPYVYATDISERAAQLAIEVSAENGRPVRQVVKLRAEVFDADDNQVLGLAETRVAQAGATIAFRVTGTVDSPRLWDPEYPHLYRAVLSLDVAGHSVDRVEVPFGIRSARWDTTQGFVINGRRLKLHGWGQKPTNEWPGLGSALPNWLHHYTLRLMKDAGGNFVRWGHAAAGPASIAASDALGLITIQPGVDGEHDTVGAAWKLRSLAFRDTVVYFRNNPSILVWEGGNQKVSQEHARELRGIMDLLDPHGGRAYAHRRADAVTAAFMHLGIGTEGGREIAGLPVVEGEYDREESPRRVWDAASPPNFGYPEAQGQTYQLTSEDFAVNQVTHYVRKLGAPDHSGGANWIFSDSTSGGRVAVEVARASGEVDGVRLPKEAYFACAAMFRTDPQVHIIGHWSYPTGTRKSIYVVSNAEQVELLVNGRSLGTQRPKDLYLFTFPDVAFEPGEIQAVASSGGHTVAVQVKRTAGQPVRLTLTPLTAPPGLSADGSDVALFDVEAVDAAGRICPTFQHRVDFQLAGPGLWRGGYNSGKVDSINNSYLDLEAGRNRVAVRSTRQPGKITLTARADGLAPAIASIFAVPFTADGGNSRKLPPKAATLPPRPPARAIRETVRPSTDLVAAAPSTVTPGRFTRAFNYSGPSSYIVHIEASARDGKNAYVDVDSPFAGLPAQLLGADYVQAAARESSYQAVDLMELAIEGDTAVWVAHDDRLPRPSWLTRQFEPTSERITLGDHSLTLFCRQAPRAESLTLGPNADEQALPAANMYLVFVTHRAAAR
jgi:beta-galactosidase